MKVFQLTPIFLLLLISNLNEVDCKRFLFWHVMASYSHRTQTWPIAEALANQGHEVVYISSAKPLGTNPKIKEIFPKSVNELVDKLINGEFDISQRIQGTTLPIHEFIFPMGVTSCELLMTSPEFKEWLESERNKKFDLFIIDNVFSECGLGLARYFSAKSIIFNTVLPIPYEYDGIGFLPQSGSIPEMEVFIPTMPMGFFDRLYNTYLSLIWRAKHYKYTFVVDEVLRKGLNSPQLPHVGDLLRNVSLVFHTGDVISDFSRSLPPIFVNVAGTHCRDSQKLPKELETFITSTKSDGFVYISLGSLVNTAKLPDNIKQVFFHIVKAFPNLKFLWKWTGELPKNIPANLYLANWFPQIDILGHSKIKAFVTQNGRPSTFEALYHGVPMISFPVLADQDYNANRLSEMGASIKLEITRVTFDEFKNAIQKAVYEPRVAQRSKMLKDIFRNRPMTPLDTALWWINYVLRYEDTAHLRTAGYDQYWFVRRQVDVWAFVSILVFVVLVITLLVLIKIVKLLFGNKKEGKANDKKKIKKK